MPVPEVGKEHADEWAQIVVDAWAINVEVGNAARLSDDFNDLFDCARRYRDAKTVADNHRQFGVLNKREATQEERTRREFVEAYKDLHKKHEENY